VARQARPVLVEELQQGQQPGLEAARRHRQDAPRVQRHGECLAVCKAAHYAQQVGLLAQQAQQRRHQADALAGDRHAQVQIEPVTADRLIDRNEPVFRLGNAIREILSKNQGDALALQRRCAFAEESQPADGVIAQGHQAIFRALQPLAVGQAALPAVEPGGAHLPPCLALGRQVALQRPPLALQPLPHQRRRLLDADDGETLRVIEVEYRERQVVVLAAHGQVAETTPRQHQARGRLAGRHCLRCIRQGQRDLPLLRQLHQALAHQRRVGFVQRRRRHHLLQQAGGEVGLQFADHSGRRIQIEGRPGRNHLQGRRQVERQLLQAGQVVRPRQLERPWRTGFERQFDQAVEVQPARAQCQPQQQGAGLAGEVDGFVVEIAAAGLQGEKQAQGRDVLVEDEVATARAAQVVGLGPIHGRLAGAALLQRPALAQGEAGRAARPQQIDHARPGSLCRHRPHRRLVEGVQPVQRRRAGFGIAGVIPRRGVSVSAKAADIGGLPQVQQRRDDVLAVFPHRAHAGIVDVDDCTARVQFQPQIDLIGMLARALHLGFDVDFAGRPLDVPDPHPTLPGVGAAALQGRAVEAAGEFGQRVAVQK
jgi:hypothetical protein